MADPRQPERSGSTVDTALLGRGNVIVLAGVGVATLGMIVTISGLLAPPLLLPGTYFIGLGLLVLAGGGTLAVWRAVVQDRTDRAVDRRT